MQSILIQIIVLTVFIAIYLALGMYDKSKELKLSEVCEAKVKYNRRPSILIWCGIIFSVLIDVLVTILYKYDVIGEVAIRIFAAIIGTVIFVMLVYTYVLVGNYVLITDGVITVKKYPIVVKQTHVSAISLTVGSIDNNGVFSGFDSSGDLVFSVTSSHVGAKEFEKAVLSLGVAHTVKMPEQSRKNAVMHHRELSKTFPVMVILPLVLSLGFLLIFSSIAPEMPGEMSNTPVSGTVSSLDLGSSSIWIKLEGDSNVYYIGSEVFKKVDFDLFAVLFKGTEITLHTAFDDEIGFKTVSAIECKGRSFLKISDTKEALITEYNNQYKNASVPLVISIMLATVSAAVFVGFMSVRRRWIAMFS